MNWTETLLFSTWLFGVFRMLGEFNIQTTKMAWPKRFLACILWPAFVIAFLISSAVEEIKEGELPAKDVRKV